jgi:hypothetical protein
LRAPLLHGFCSAKLTNDMVTATASSGVANITHFKNRQVPSLHLIQINREKIMVTNELNVVLCTRSLHKKHFILSMDSHFHSLLIAKESLLHQVQK